MTRSECRLHAATAGSAVSGGLFMQLMEYGRSKELSPFRPIAPAYTFEQRAMERGFQAARRADGRREPIEMVGPQI